MINQRINTSFVSINSARSMMSRSWTCQAVAQQQSKPWKITRGASTSQKLPILKTLLAEKLNPLSLDINRFVVATLPATEDKLIGFGQLKPLDATSLELSSLVVDSEYR